MPATTGISAVPSGRPGVEAQIGLVPGYFLSQTAQEPTHEGDPDAQLLALIEPDRWLGTRGLVVGMRRWGRNSDGAFEPFLGYRHRIDDDFAVALVGYGTQMSGAENGASYRATRLGGELALDARMIKIARWLAVHGQAAVSATYLNASGTYCVGSNGLGGDCDQVGNHPVDGEISGLFPAATASLALDFGRRPAGRFHGFRVALLGTAGTMPQLRDGSETERVRYVSAGVAWTIGFGESK
jgi:hypothetical protein